MASYDLDGDGVISSDELIAAAEALANDLQERLLTKYDANQDGTITSEEALAVHQAIVDGKINALLETYDLNGDGEITGAEIDTAHQRRYGGRHGGFRRQNERVQGRGRSHAGSRPRLTRKFPGYLKVWLCAGW